MPGRQYRNGLTSTASSEPITLRVRDRESQGDEPAGRLRRLLPGEPLGINVVLNYTEAYTTYGVKCVI